jgi:hypothetical protein
MASWAYAARMRRLGRSYFAGAVAALYVASDDTTIVYRGPMPSTVRRSTERLD